uniref:Uncharacterized protein n=1 Tax=Hazenia capsulata TaxID=2202518 RepID=A0A1W6EHL6_9CHLO|nr:hypothetical protein CCM22_pgp054 [Hazenia capsulata]ARK14907.1 hypothetical protein [Hazenia capsulata]
MNMQRTISSVLQTQKRQGVKSVDKSYGNSDELARQHWLAKTVTLPWPDSRESILISIQVYYLDLKFYDRRNHGGVFKKLEEHFNQDILLSSIFAYWFENRFQTSQNDCEIENAEFLKNYHMDLKDLLLMLGYKKEKVISPNRLYKAILILLENHPQKQGDWIELIRTSEGIKLKNTRLQLLDPLEVFSSLKNPISAQKNQKNNCFN